MLRSGAVAAPVDLAPFAEGALALLGRFQAGAEARAPLGRALQGAFSSRPGAAPDLYGACDAAFALWILGELDARSDADGRRAWAARIAAFQDPDRGWFDRSLLPGHGVPHATAFATAALRLLGEAPDHPLRYAEVLFADRAAVDAWLEGFRWGQIWTGSHAAGAAAAVLDAPRGVVLPEDWTRQLLAALSERVDPRTGFWKRAPHDRLWRRPTAVDLGGAAHFWWLYDRLGQPVPHPERVIDGILGLQRRSGLWGSRVFGGAFPHGLDLDALHGLRVAWRAADAGFRASCHSRLLAGLARYAAAADRLLNPPGAVERWFRGPHKLVGTLNALAELDALFRELGGDSPLVTPRPWRSTLRVVTWQ